MCLGRKEENKKSCWRWFTAGTEEPFRPVAIVQAVPDDLNRRAVFFDFDRLVAVVDAGDPKPPARKALHLLYHLVPIDTYIIDAVVGYFPRRDEAKHFTRSKIRKHAVSHDGNGVLHRTHKRSFADVSSSGIVFHVLGRDFAAVLRLVVTEWPGRQKGAGLCQPVHANYPHRVLVQQR